QLVTYAGWHETGERSVANVLAVVDGGFTNEDPDLLRLEYSCESIRAGGGRNYARYCNPDFDPPAREAHLAPLNGRRVALYEQMQALLLGDAASVPFIGENLHLGLRATVRDVWTNSLGTYPVFVDTWLDK